MSADYQLNPEGEREWLRLKQHLEWSDHFALGFIFTAHPGVITVFRQRLAGIYHARITRLHIPIPEKPSQLLDELLPNLLHPTVHQQCLQGPFWLDLSKKSGADWASARLSFLIRLNEQREPLRRVLKRPLILILPLSERSSIREVVPDLWAIRDFSITTGDWLAAPDESFTTPEKLPSSSFPISDYNASLIHEWERLMKKNAAGHTFIPAAHRACMAALHTAQYELAAKIAASMQKTAENIIENIGETPEALRDLSVSLDNVGNTAKAMGQWDKAQLSFEESLNI
ncbi:MAG TPA: hypothetical protein EYG88_06640, partial [Desulfocapsa sulfexigens]|nr:hypothetical protein [Desulfocapsa sulfexigens]